MKKFRQQFKIAIITSSDGFTEININFANQVSSRETAGHTKCARRGTENSMEYLEGRPWPFTL